MSRTQFGFSPLDSLRIALAAARAAKAFQPTRSRASPTPALPPLVTYYSLLASAVPGGFDVWFGRRRVSSSTGGRRGAKPWAPRGTA
ncbi:hypothetical protein CP49_19680 [Bradyrhizobium valentinum]|uniref:Uncharacterized protein n=1 Tax=Bradyrhizobium valentinum TaxID=1518501 RepID=A0A0R3LUY1_9BRAD|nr:hypothetical protein CP49_19680 [Bradyrhizobium valentinum]